MKPQKAASLLASMLLLQLLAALAACGQASKPPQAGVLDYAELVANLRAEGATVTEQGTIRENFGLSGQARAILVDGTRVQVYEYDDADAAAADAQHISSDGTTFRYQDSSGVGQGIVVDFIAPPNWYRGGRILVLYVGTDSSIQTLLEQQLGSPFAGGNPYGQPAPSPTP